MAAVPYQIRKVGFVSVGRTNVEVRANSGFAPLLARDVNDVERYESVGMKKTMRTIRSPKDSVVIRIVLQI